MALRPGSSGNVGMGNPGVGWTDPRLPMSWISEHRRARRADRVACPRGTGRYRIQWSVAIRETRGVGVLLKPKEGLGDVATHDRRPGGRRGGLGLRRRGAVQTAGASVFSDPFTFYFAVYLPRQQLMANQPGPELAVNNQAINRQMMALTDRSGLNNPVDPYGLGQSFDPNDPFAGRRVPTRNTMTSPGGVRTTHVNGSGPAGYYGRTAMYFPSMRSGRRAPQAGGARPISTGASGRGIGGGMMGGGMMGGFGGGFR